MENASYEDMYNWAKENFGADIRLLYNLDGGKSSALVINGKNIFSGKRNVKNTICFKQKGLKDE